jgi:hypothetical protein
LLPRPVIPMTRPKVPPGASSLPIATSRLTGVITDQRQRTARACESCKRRKQKASLAFSHPYIINCYLRNKRTWLLDARTTASSAPILLNIIYSLWCAGICFEFTPLACPKFGPSSKARRQASRNARAQLHCYPRLVNHEALEDLSCCGRIFIVSWLR